MNKNERWISERSEIRWSIETAENRPAPVGSRWVLPASYS